LIAYSTAPGEVALDGEGRNSPYAASLMAALQSPKQHVLLTFQDIALRVQTTTRGQQIPWISSSLTRNFYFNEKDDFNKDNHAQGITIASQPTSIKPIDAFSKHTPKHSPKQLSKPSPEAIPLLTIEELERPWRLPPEDYPEVIQDTLANGSVGPRLVIVPPGSYQMGSQDQIREEHPRHPVTLTQPLAVGLYEVSVGEYQRYLSAMSSGQSSSQRSGQPSNHENHEANSLSNRPSGPSADLPITNIRWQQAVDYTQWLSRETGHRYRLPSESEWEYLARAGTDSRYFWGNELAQCTELPISHIDRSRKFKTNEIPFCAQQLKSLGLVRLNCRHCFSWIEQGKAFPVDSYLPNPFGLFNMLGNVAEFTLDCWRPNYYGAATDHTPVQFANCTERVIRGGHWNSSHLEVRVSARQGVDEAYQSDTLGFRVVREID
jgi:formylglycine-generating enzyme required for sulfatase activity